MRSAVYFLRDLAEFVFGSFIGNPRDRTQPINPVGPIESIPIERSGEAKAEVKQRIKFEREKALKYLDKCLRAEYKAEYPVRGNQNNDG